MAPLSLVVGPDPAQRKAEAEAHVAAAEAKVAKTKDHLESAEQALAEARAELEAI